MAFDKYIKIGVSRNEHNEIKAKASRMGLNMQEVGHGWFMNWLSGKQEDSIEETAHPDLESDQTDRKLKTNDLLLVPMQLQEGTIRSFSVDSSITFQEISGRD